MTCYDHISGIDYWVPHFSTMASAKNNSCMEILSKVKILFLDFDGVLTDGYVYVDEDGKEMVRCSRRDSLGLRMLRDQGVAVAVVSKETNSVVRERCKKLMVECFYGVDTKASFLRGYLDRRQILPAQASYVGDDVNDLEAMKMVGASIAVGNAVNAVKEIALYVTQNKGGEGAVREICDLILKAKGAAEK